MYSSVEKRGKRKEVLGLTVCPVRPKIRGAVRTGLTFGARLVF